MKTTVTRIVKDWTTSRLPIVFANTMCGHGADVVLLPTIMRCIGCGATQEIASLGGTTVRCACGKWAHEYAFHAEPHNQKHWITMVGNEVDCRECDSYAESLARFRALTPADVQHTRFRPYDSRGGSEGAIYVYKRDTTSPSGVMLLMSIQSTPEVDAICSALRASPLSPTEGLGGR